MYGFYCKYIISASGPSSAFFLHLLFTTTRQILHWNIKPLQIWTCFLDGDLISSVSADVYVGLLLPQWKKYSEEHFCVFAEPQGCGSCDSNSKRHLKSKNCTVDKQLRRNWRRMREAFTLTVTQHLQLASQRETGRASSTGHRQKTDQILTNNNLISV